MDITWFVLLLLLPGAMAMKLRDAITGEGKRGFNDALLSASMYVLVVYGLVVLLSLARPLGLTPVPIGTRFNPWTIAAVVGISLVVGFVAGIVDERRWLLKLVSRFKLSRRGWRNTWADSFLLSSKQWVNVHLADGRQIDGWAQYYSGDAKRPSIYVARGSNPGEEVTILSPDGQKETSIPGLGVLITPEAKITLVQFLDPD